MRIGDSEVLGLFHGAVMDVQELAGSCLEATCEGAGVVWGGGGRATAPLPPCSRVSRFG
jgi:hypothetical protein